MTPLNQIVLTFVIGVIASFIGNIAGGGGLITIPFLIFVGLPPQVAIATNKLGGIGLSIGGIIKFWKEKKIVWKYVLPLSLCAIIGGILGAKLLIEINEKILSTVIGIILLSMLVLIFIKKEIGIKKRKTSKLQKRIGIGVYFLIMIFAGFFGGGAGTLVFYCLMYFMGVTIIEANATDMIPLFLVSLSSLTFFMFYGLVAYPIGIALCFGMILGGYIGAHTAIKKGNAWVKMIFGVVVIFSSVKLLFF